MRRHRRHCLWRLAPLWFCFWLCLWFRIYLVDGRVFLHVQLCFLFPMRFFVRLQANLRTKRGICCWPRPMGLAIVSRRSQCACGTLINFLCPSTLHTHAHTCKAQSQSLKRESGVGSIKINETHKRFKEETDKMLWTLWGCFEGLLRKKCCSRRKREI